MQARRRNDASAPNRVPVVALVAALGLGIAGRVAVHAADLLPHGDGFVATGRVAVALGGPWLAVAWAIGALAGAPRRGVRLGGAALAIGTAAWYLLTVAADGRAGLHYAVPVAAAWLPVALGAGALFGFIGGSWSDGSPGVRAASVAGLAGALAGEALLLAGEWTTRAAHAILSLELAAAIALLLLCRRRATLGVTLVVFVVAAVVCAGAEAGVRHALQAAGWDGATLGS